VRIQVDTFIAFLGLILISAVSCVQQWTPEEKGNAEHFVKSLSLILEAHSNPNKRIPGEIARQDFDKIVSLYQDAFKEADLVRDKVLDKIHPELKNNYRLYFQKGVELRISAWTNGKTYDEIQGSALMDSWGDWFEKNRNNLKIPR
jgi:hypothetical protein